MEFKTQVITGFKTQQPTVINSKTIGISPTEEEASNLPSNVDANAVKNLIMRHRDVIFNNLPTDFSQDNIIINKLGPNNSKGILNVDFDINNYYDHYGVLVNDGRSKMNFVIDITGFDQDHQTTSISSSIDGGDLIKNMIANDSLDPKNRDVLKKVILRNLADTLIPIESIQLSDITVDVTSC